MGYFLLVRENALIEGKTSKEDDWSSQEDVFCFSLIA